MNGNHTSYLLRSASKKNNTSRNQGVYSKFFQRNSNKYLSDSRPSTLNSVLNINAALSETINSRVSQPLRRSLFKQVDLNSSRRQIDTSVNNVTRAERDTSQVKNETTMNGDTSRPNRNESSVRDPEDTPMKFRTADGDSVTIRSKIIGSDLFPKVVVKRYEPEYDESGRPIGLKRDPQGFLVPAVPVSLKKTWDEEKRSLKKILSELMDESEPTEAYYIIKKTEDQLQQIVKKNSSKPSQGCREDVLDRERKENIVNWLNSTSAAGEAPLPPPVAASVISGLPPLTLKEYAESVITACQKVASSQQGREDGTLGTKKVYSLRDWTIVKGRGPDEVMVSGDLMDICTRTLIEEGHISSKVLSADHIVVQTSCCIYHLAGEFVNVSGIIPYCIAKYFKNGKFPSQWKEVIQMWSVIREKEMSQIYAHQQSNRSNFTDTVREGANGYSRRDREQTWRREEEELDFERRQRGVDRLQEPGTSRAGLKSKSTTLTGGEKNGFAIWENNGYRQRDIKRNQASEKSDNDFRSINRDRHQQPENSRVGVKLKSTALLDDDDIRPLNDYYPVRDNDDGYTQRDKERRQQQESSRLGVKSKSSDPVDREEEAERTRRNASSYHQSSHVNRTLFQRNPVRENGFSRRETEKSLNRDDDYDDGDDDDDREDDDREKQQTHQTSRVTRKRKSTAPLQDEEDREDKKRRLDLEKRKATPAANRRGVAEVIKKRNREMTTIVETPKSIRRRNLKFRRKTPMPPRKPKVTDSAGSLPLDYSDLM